MNLKIFSVCMVTLLSLSACNTPPINEISSTTKFHLLTEFELRRGMQAMADQLGYIALTSLDSTLAVSEQQNRIVPSLQRIQKIALDLDYHGPVTNYSAINRYISSFLY
jgi:hypothetical protein